MFIFFYCNYCIILSFFIKFWRKKKEDELNVIIIFLVK